jgi:hypothetical protein
VLFMKADRAAMGPRSLRREVVGPGLPNMTRLMVSRAPVDRRPRPTT